MISGIKNALTGAKDMIAAIPSTAKVVNQVSELDLAQLHNDLRDITEVAKAYHKKLDSVDLEVVSKLAEKINNSGLLAPSFIDRVKNLGKADRLITQAQESSLYPILEGVLSYISKMCGILSDIVGPVFWLLKLFIDKIVGWLTNKTKIGEYLYAAWEILEMLPSLMALAFPVLVSVARDFTVEVSLRAWRWILELMSGISSLCATKFSTWDLSWIKRYFFEQTDTEDLEEAGVQEQKLNEEYWRARCRFDSSLGDERDYSSDDDYCTLVDSSDDDSDIEFSSAVEESDDGLPSLTSSDRCDNEISNGRERTMLPHAVAFAVAMTAAPIIGIRPNQNLFDEALRRTNALACIANGVLDLTFWMSNSFSNVVTDTISSFLGWNKPSNRFFGIVCSMMENLSLQWESEGRACFTNHQWLSAVGFVGPMFDTYIAKNRNNLTDGDNNRIERVRRGRSKYYTQALKVAKQSRMEPLGVWMYGGSGIGKTLCSMCILYWVFCGKYSIEDLIYVCNMNDQFSPNYNANPVYFLDDAGALDTPESLKQMGELLTICSSANYPLNQADLEDKGMPFLSMIVWATSNKMVHEITKGFTTPEAFWRRWQVICRPVIASEYKSQVCDKYGHLEPTKAFDIEKYPNMDWLKICVEDWDKTELVGMCHYSVQEFVTLIQKKLINKRKATNLVSEVTKQYGKKFIGEDYTEEFMEPRDINCDLGAVGRLTNLSRSDMRFLKEVSKRARKTPVVPKDVPVVVATPDSTELPNEVSRGYEIKVPVAEHKSQSIAKGGEMPPPGDYEGSISRLGYQIDYKLTIYDDYTFELHVNCGSEIKDLMFDGELVATSDGVKTVMNGDGKFQRVTFKHFHYQKHTEDSPTVFYAQASFSLFTEVGVRAHLSRVVSPRNAVHAAQTAHFEAAVAVYHASFGKPSVYDGLYNLTRDADDGTKEHHVSVNEEFVANSLEIPDGIPKDTFRALIDSYTTDYVHGDSLPEVAAYVHVCNFNVAQSLADKYVQFPGLCDAQLNRETMGHIGSYYYQGAELTNFVDSCQFYATAYIMALKKANIATWDQLYEVKTVENFSPEALRRDRKQIATNFSQTMARSAWTKDHEKTSAKLASKSIRERICSISEDAKKRLKLLSITLSSVAAVVGVVYAGKKIYDRFAPTKITPKKTVEETRAKDVLSSLQKTVVEQNSQGVYSHKTMRQRRSRGKNRGKKSNLANERSNGETDASDFATIPQVQKLANNTCSIVVGKSSLTGVFVEKKYFMTNLHIFLKKGSTEFVEDGTECLLIGTTAMKFEFKRERLHVEKANVGGVEVESEIVIYDFSYDKRMNAKPSIVNLFMDYKRFEQIKLEKTFVLHRQTSPVVHIEDVGYSSVAHRIQRFRSNFGQLKGENAFATATIHYTPDLGKGSCGSLLVTSKHPQAFGVHFGYSTSMKRSNSAAITRERLRAMIARINPQVLISDARSSEVPPNIGDHLEYFGPSHICINDFQNANSLQKSVFCGLPMVDANTTVKTKTSDAEFRRAGLDPVKEDAAELSKFVEQSGSYVEEDLVEVETEVQKFVLEGTIPTGCWAIADAINGNGALKRLSFNTSMGPSWKSQAEGRGKKAFFCFNEESQRWIFNGAKGDKVRQAVTDLYWRLSKEGYDPHNRHVLSEYSRKAEARGPHKGTRSINVFDGHFLLLFRVMFGDLMESFQGMFKGRDNSFSTLGINPLGKDWDDMINRLSKNDYWLDGDIRKFEGLIGRRAIESFKELTHKYYSRNLDNYSSPEWVESENVDFERDMRVRDNLIENCMSVLLYYKGHLYKKKSGLSSGAPITSILNTYWNCIMLGYCWVRIMKANGALKEMSTAQYYVWQVPKVFNGDDHVINVPKEALCFNLKSVKAEFEKLGGGYTPAEKNKECTEHLKTCPSEVLYLKNYSHWDGRAWRSWAEHDSIVKSLKWVSGKMDRFEASLINLANALLRLAPSGRERFDDYRSLCVAHLVSKGYANLEGVIWNYDTCKHLVSFSRNVDLLELVDECLPDDIVYDPVAPKKRDLCVLHLC